MLQHRPITQMDKETNEQMNEWTKREMDSRTDGRIEGSDGEWSDGRSDEKTD